MALALRCHVDALEIAHPIHCMPYPYNAMDQPGCWRRREGGGVMKRLWIGVGCLVLACAGLLWISWRSGSSEDTPSGSADARAKTRAEGNEGAAEVPVLRIAHVGHDHHLALFVAADRGEALRDAAAGAWLQTLKDRDMYMLMSGQTPVAQMRFLQVGGGSIMPAALARGEVDYGLGGIPAIVFAIDQGVPIRLIAPLNTDGDMLVVRPDFPATSWAEFVERARGQEAPIRIGYKAPRAVAYLLFREALRVEGLRAGQTLRTQGGEPVDVLLVNLQHDANVFPTLAAGAVDGIVMNQPDPARAEILGMGRILTEIRDLPPAGRWTNHPCCGLAASEAVLAAHPEVTQHLLQTLVAAERWMQAHTEESAVIASRWTGAPLEVERRSIPTVVYGSEPTPTWNRGMETWFALIREQELFTGRLAGRDGAPWRETVLSFQPLETAIERLPAREGAGE